MKNPSLIWLWRLLGALAVVALLYGGGVLLNTTINDYVVRVIILAGIAIILATSLNLINGITGQFSLGHAGFMAIGAYAAGRVSYYLGPRLVAALVPGGDGSMPSDIVSGAPFWLAFAVFVLALIAGAVLAGLFGWLVGLPSLRLRGDYLAIVTLGFGEIIRVVIQNIEEVGGAAGFNGLPLIVDSSRTWLYFVWVYALAILCVLSIRNLATSNLGRAMRAVREDEVAAEAAGVNTTRVKVLAFVISAMWAGVAGGLQAHFNQSAHPESFNFIKSVEIVVMVVLGGLGSITGATLAAVLLTFLENVLRTVSGAFAVGLSLVLLAATLSFVKRRGALLVRRDAIAWLHWMVWPLLSLGLILFIYLEQQEWLERNISALRYVIYAFILIVLMLLRPQGLLGRAEFSLAGFGRLFNRGAGQPPSEVLSPVVTDEPTARPEPANEGIEGGLQD